MSRPLSPKFPLSLVQKNYHPNRRGREVRILNFSTKRISQLSFLIALTIIFTRVFSIRIPVAGVEGVRVGFGALPIIFAGIAFGPLAGGIVGGLGDLLGYFINPLGAYMPHFTLTSFLTGFIPGLIVFYVLKRCRSLTVIFTAISIGQLITSIILVPYFINTLFGVPFAVLMPPRLISQLINIPLYTYFIMVVLNHNTVNIREIRAGTSC